MTSTRVTPNAAQQPVNIVGGNDYGLFPKISSERTQNMYVTMAGSKELDNQEVWLVSYPGYNRVLNILPYPSPFPENYTPNEQPVGSGRAAFNSIRGGFAVFVVNSVVYRMNTDFALITIGTLNSPSGEVFIAENLASQICLVDGVNAYIYDYSLGVPNLTVQTDGALGSGALIPNYVEYHNSFFLFGNGNRTSNGAAWYAYSFSTNTAAANAIVQNTQMALQTKADFALAIKKLPGQGNNVMVFGTTVSEIFTQVGGLLNYQRNQSRNINYGCASISTIADSGDMIAWLAINEEESPVIMFYDGNADQRISTDGIDHVLDNIVAPSSSTALFFRQDGHLFYQLTFYDKRDNLTLIYDFNTQLFFTLTDQYGNYHPARQLIYFNLKVYFISLNNAALYELNSNFTNINENLNPPTPSNLPDVNLIYDIPRMRITSSSRAADSARFRANSLVVTLEQGNDPAYIEAEEVSNYYLITEDIFVGAPDTPIITENGQNIIISDPSNPYFNPDIPYTPHIDLAISKDGGQTWSSNVRRDLHFLGHRQNILHWENFGVANDLTFRFNCVGSYRFVLNNGILDIIT